MATIAPFNYVSTPSPPPVVKPPPLSLKMPPSTQASPVTPCSPSTEYLHRHISKLISENQAIVETSDPYLSKKYYQRTKQEKEMPSSPNRSQKVSPRTIYPSPPPASPAQWHPLVLNSTPSSPLFVSSASYEAAYIKSLMSSPSPSSPLSSASSSSSTEFSWPRKPQPVNNHQPQQQQLQLAWQYQSAMLSAKQQAESKLASALLRPNHRAMMSSNQSIQDEDQSCQPLNLTVKPTNHVDSKNHSRKRSFNSSFPDESSSQERVKFSVDSMVGEKPKSLFIRPEDDLKSQRPFLSPNMLLHNIVDIKGDNFILNSSLIDGNRGKVVMNSSDHRHNKNTLRRGINSPVKVSPPLPSPGPLLGSTPLIDTRSHIPTLRSLEELSRSPMRQHSFQMFGGEVQIRDAIGDAKTMRIEPNKLKLSREIDHTKTIAKVVTMAKSAELNSGGTTILQVPQPSESAQVPKINHSSGVDINLSRSNMLIIPVMSKPPTATVPLAGSPHVITSSISASPLTVTSPYNGGVLTLLHAGKAIPHVPGIPGPLTMTQWEDSKTEQKSKLSAEVKPIVQMSSAESTNKVIKNGRVPSLSEPAKSPRQSEESSQTLPSSAIHPLTPHLILVSISFFYSVPIALFNIG